MMVRCAYMLLTRVIFALYKMRASRVHECTYPMDLCKSRVPKLNEAGFEGLGFDLVYITRHIAFVGSCCHVTCGKAWRVSVTFLVWDGIDAESNS